jgi:hypothetical protein
MKFQNALMLPGLVLLVQPHISAAQSNASDEIGALPICAVS